jgi:hypothetical protein
MLWLIGCLLVCTPRALLEAPAMAAASQDVLLPSRISFERHVPNADSIVRCAVRRARHVIGTRLKMGTDATVWVDVAIIHTGVDEPSRVSVDAWWRKTPRSAMKTGARTTEPMASDKDAQAALDRALARIWGGNLVTERCAP